MGEHPMHTKQKGQAELPMLLLGLLVLAAVAAVFVLAPGDTLGPATSPNTPAAQEEGPREIVDVGDTPERTEDRTPSNERELTGSVGDGRPLGAAIVGSVIDTQGNPVPDAQVHLTESLAVQNPFAPQSTKGTRYSITSDADGRYRFPRLPVGVEFSMWVTHKQHAPREGFPVRALAKEEQVLQPIVLDEGYRIEGFVRDEAGNPLQGAIITVRLAQVLNFMESDDQLMEERNLGRLREVEADANGAFVFNYLAEGIYQLEARLADFGTGVENAITCMGEDKIQIREMVLGTEHRMAGIVRDEEGNPIPDAMVAAARTRPRPIYQEEGVTDEGGSFELRGLPAGSYGISVIAEGYASARMSHVQSNRTDLEFVMRRKAGVSGRVAKPDGTPITTYSLELFRVNQGTAQYGATNRIVPVQSDDGTYLFPDLDRGSYVVLVRAQDYSPTYSSGFYVERDLVTDVNITLETGGILRGRVLDPESNPLAGAIVTLRGRDYNAWHQHSLFGASISDPNNVPTASARTNSKGEFELRDAYPGDHQLEVKHNNYLTLYVGVFVQADRVSQVGDVIMRRGSSIEGLVTVRGGGAAAGASIYLTLKDENAGFFNKKIIADARGRYRFDGLRPGTYEVAAIREDANAFFFPGASPGSSQDVLIQREAEAREVKLIVPAEE
ncbi:MAG: carboxypeptidase-like regulatory domain-containing protein [Planctomycetes bacterium]|nr:carboxypeptidase-like regulatory domain-containing protein [Planctomycetota bacterium]